MDKSYSIRSDLDNFLKSKKLNHDTLIKTLVDKSKNVNTKTDVLTWLSDNPEDIESFEKWMRNNGGKPLLDKINGIASECAHSNENKEDQKLYQVWSDKVAANVVSSKVFNDFKTTIETQIKSLQLKDDQQDKEIKSLRKKIADQEYRIQELERELAEKVRQIKQLKQIIQDLKKELKLANKDKANLVKKLREKEHEISMLRDNVRKLEEKLQTALEKNSQLEEALRAEREHKVISETDTTLEESNNALAEEIKAMTAKLSKLSAAVKQLNDIIADRSCSPSTDYMLSSDDADNYSTKSQSV